MNIENSRCIFSSAASHISQKIKTTYKASTSKIVSSFRQAPQAYYAVRSFHGHKDGVWEVRISKVDPHYIGTASAGKRFTLIFNQKLIRNPLLHRKC